MLSCRSSGSNGKMLFNLEILPLLSLYILFLLLFVIKTGMYLWSILRYITLTHINFHQPSANSTKYQKGVYDLGGGVLNVLHSYIKLESNNPKKFKLILNTLLYENSFYSLDEYFELQKN